MVNRVDLAVGASTGTSGPRNLRLPPAAGAWRRAKFVENHVVLLCPATGPCGDLLRNVEGDARPYYGITHLMRNRRYSCRHEPL